MRNRVIRGYLLICLCVGWLVFFAPGPSFGAQPPELKTDLNSRLARLVGPADAVAVAATDGTLLAAVHADELLVPASILKVLTSLAAIHYLGSTFRYPTDFFIDSKKNLKVKGYGDPLLVSEKIHTITRRLAQQIDAIQDLVLDDTYFTTPIVIPGRRRHSLQPYDAPNGALCVNFNTVFFQRRNGQWVSAEEQTPLLPSVIPKIEASGLTNGRITLAGNADEGMAYAGELFRYFLTQAGVAVNGKVVLASVDSQQDLLLQRHLADEELTDVISNLLEFSNNFIANQLMLTMGAHAYEPPATVDKGMRALRRYYHQVLGITDGHIAEASGISRQNRISARIMLQLLAHFKDYHHLMRQKGTRRWYKTGHLKNVRTQAGYLTGKDGQLYTYVVMVNTPGKTTDRIIAAIENSLR